MIKLTIKFTGKAEEDFRELLDLTKCDSKDIILDALALLYCAVTNKSIKSYIRESRLVSMQIADWLNVSLKDGDSVSKLCDPELMALFERDQELFDEIVRIDPSYKDLVMSPKEFHRHLVELARGQYKQTH